MTLAVSAQAEAAREADDSAKLLADVTARGWIAEGLRADGSLQALGATMRPIDALSSAGLDALRPHVEPLQQVLDRMAGNAAVIQSFADAWQRAGTQISEVHQQLGRRVPADTAEWTGDAADLYRDRAGEITESLRSAATMCSATGELARTMGEVVAGARTTVNDLLTDLVGRLISYTRQAMAVEGGLTPSVLAQATRMIDSYRTPVTDVEQRLQRTVANAERLLTGRAQVAAADPRVAIVAAILAAIAKALARLARRMRRRRNQDWERAEREGREREERARRVLEEIYRREHERGLDYRQQCEAIYGAPPADGRRYEAHHNFPVEFAQRFRALGIDTSDPKWCSWVAYDTHRGMSAEVSRDWEGFFQNPDNGRAEALDFARELGRKYDYQVPWANLPWAR
jgi:hypothetical protein